MSTTADTSQHPASQGGWQGAAAAPHLACHQIPPGAAQKVGAAPRHGQGHIKAGAPLACSAAGRHSSHACAGSKAKLPKRCIRATSPDAQARGPGKRGQARSCHALPEKLPRSKLLRSPVRLIMRRAAVLMPPPLPPPPEGPVKERAAAARRALRPGVSGLELRSSSSQYSAATRAELRTRQGREVRALLCEAGG